ncbi:MAG: tetratricopeptide repeat protein [Polyangiaceae bacterium]
MRRRTLAAGFMMLTTCAGIVALGATSADAAGKKKDGTAFHPDHDPNNVTGLSEAVEIVSEGNKKFVDKDIQGAIDAYRRAIALAPKNPLGHYMLGVGLLAAGNPQEAEISLKQAVDVGESNPGVKARALFALADLKERQKKWEDAKAAWQTYADYVTKHVGAGYTESSQAKLSSLDDMLKQDKAYDVVRERIAADKDGGAKK